ncbi:hypothetical protein D3C71_1962670 [compost metagenome]
MTNVEHLWVAGDVAVHAEQATVAMGEEAIAGIWMHKELKTNKPYCIAIIQVRGYEYGETLIFQERAKCHLSFR